MKDIIPAHAREQVYAWFAVLGVVIGATQVGFSAANAGQPVWLTVALAVYAFVGGAIGFAARANTPREYRTPDEIEADRNAGKHL